MRQGAPTRLAATSCGLAGFAIAIFAGLAADNPADEILSRALMSMFICWAAGAALGFIGERGIDEHVQNLRETDDTSMRVEEPGTGDSESGAVATPGQPNVAA